LGKEYNQSVSRLELMAIAFSDIQNHWAQAPIAELVQRSLVNGYPDGSFRPDATITRAELAVVLQRAFPNTPQTRSAKTFTDVPATHWAAQAISTVYKMGFLSGYPDASFKPDRPLERVQAFVALVSGLRYGTPANSKVIVQKYFDDVGRIPNYAIEPLAAAIEYRLVVNYPNVKQFKPLQNATRGEIAAAISLALNISNAVPPQYVAGVFEIPPQFEQAEDFSNGLAQVIVNKKIGFIDTTGKLVTPTLFDGVGKRAEGLQPVTIGSKGGYIDSTLKLVIPAKFDGVDSFSEGLAIVKVGEKFGYIDKTGKFVGKAQFDALSPFTTNQELAPVFMGGRFGYVDRTGKIVIQPQFIEASLFSEGLARVKIGDRYGFIDKTGKVVIQPQFFTVDSFSEGLATFSENYKYGFIDKTGNVAIQPQFEVTGRFSEGLAMVRLNNKAGYIDKTGTVVIQPQFESAYPFSKGRARARVNGKLGYIDKTGTFVIQPQFEGAGAFSGGLAKVNVGGQWEFAAGPSFVSGGKWGYIRNPLKKP
jgi:hypothetical protein